MRPTAIRAPKGPHEIMIEFGELPTLGRQYVKRSRLQHWQRQGWIVWYPAGTGWTREQPRWATRHAADQGDLS